MSADAIGRTKPPTTLVVLVVVMEEEEGEVLVSTCSCGGESKGSEEEEIGRRARGLRRLDSEERDCNNSWVLLLLLPLPPLGCCC